jgi:hypothetical protein
MLSSGKPLDRNVHARGFKRCMERAGLHMVWKTHFGRKAGVMYYQTVFGLTLPQTNQLGGWAREKSVNQMFYSTLADNNALAATAGFCGRVNYFLPRAEIILEELHGEQFAAIHKMIAEDGWGAAGEMLRKFKQARRSSDDWEGG